MDNQNYHEVIVGGNLWFNYQFKKLRFQDLGLLKENPCIYCLQYSTINKIILDTLKKSSNILWHIRLHPREVHKIEIIKKF